MLTAQPPFRADTVYATLLKVTTEEPETPDDWVPSRVKPYTWNSPRFTCIPKLRPGWREYLPTLRKEESE